MVRLEIFQRKNFMNDLVKQKKLHEVCETDLFANKPLQSTNFRPAYCYAKPKTSAL